MGNYFQTTGSVGRLESGPGEVLLNLPPLTDDGLATQDRPHVPPGSPRVDTKQVCDVHHPATTVLTGASVSGKLFAFVTYIFVYKILITSFIV